MVVVDLVAIESVVLVVVVAGVEVASMIVEAVAEALTVAEAADSMIEAVAVDVVASTIEEVEEASVRSDRMIMVEHLKINASNSMINYSKC